MDRPYSSGKTTASLVALFVLLVVVALIFFRLSGNTPDLQNIVGNTIKKMDLLSEMRVNLLRSEETEKSAVMADTDEASEDFAEQSRMAVESLERDRRELEALLDGDHTDQEMKLFHEFDRCWTELQKIDQEILAFAVQNTNIKAAALSFGDGNKAMKRLEQALGKLIHSPITGERCSDVIVPASDARAAGLRMQTLQAPHIIAASDALMDEIEAEMRQDNEIVEASLKKLSGLLPEGERTSLQDARTAFDDFTAITAEVVRLSRENTNIMSFGLSLGRKRKAAAQCDEVLISMQEAVRKRQFKATR